MKGRGVGGGERLSPHFPPWCFVVTPRRLPATQATLATSIIVLIYWHDVYSIILYTGTWIEMHQSLMPKPCFLCSSCIWFAFEYIFKIYLDTLAWISFAKFEINFRNPLIGCQCFDFVCPKARSVHPNWCTRSNFVRPESRSVRPGCNDMLWIQRWVYNKDHNECTADHKYK